MLLATGNTKNVLRFSTGKKTGETITHILGKLNLCLMLKRMGHEFYTEAKFKRGGRADVFDATDQIAYEVLESEEESNIENKAEYYPCEIRAYKAETLAKELTGQ